MRTELISKIASADLETALLVIVVALISSAGTVLCSPGFWAHIQSKDGQNVAMRRMITGLGHDRIMWLGMHYIKRGSITSDEFENLFDYLFVPYQKLGGNGSAERVMKEVSNLPIINNKEK